MTIIEMPSLHRRRKRADVGMIQRRRRPRFVQQAGRSAWLLECTTFSATVRSRVRSRAR